MVGPMPPGQTGRPPDLSASGFHPGIWTSILGGQGADIASTMYAMNKGGMHESNPLMFGARPGAMIPMKLGIGALAAYAASKMRKENPKISKALTFGSALTGVGAGIHNFIKASQK